MILADHEQVLRAIIATSNDDTVLRKAAKLLRMNSERPDGVRPATLARLYHDALGEGVDYADDLYDRMLQFIDVMEQSSAYKRNATIQISCSEDERIRIQCRAKANRQSVSDYVRCCCLED